MPKIMKEINLSPLDIYNAIRQLRPEETTALASLLEQEIEMDPVHQLPKSFVKEIKRGLREAKKSNVSPWED